MKLFIALCTIWLLPFVITSFFNQPAIDDFWNANTVIAHGKWGAIPYFYQTVSARYSANFIMSFCNTLPFGKMWIFKVWPVVIILFLLASFYFFYRSVFGKSVSALQATAFSFVFVVLHLANMRSVFEGLYWMSSTVCYQLAIGFFVISIGAIIKDSKKPALSTKLTAILSCIILPGTAETIIPVYILTLLLILYLSYRLHYSKKLIIYCLAITVLILLFIVSGKGNIDRIKNDGLSYNPHFFEALFYSLKAVCYYAVLWLVNPLTLSTLLLIASSQNWFAKSWNFVLQKREVLLIYAVSFLMFIAVYFPLNFFESSTPFPRVTTLFFFLFFHCLLMTGQRFISLSKKRIYFVERFARIKYIKPVLLVTFFICAFTNRNLLLISKDLFNGTALKYDEETNQRYCLIRNCTTDTCYVPAHKSWPYFVQSSAKENTNPNAFQHEDLYFKKIILVH